MKKKPSPAFHLERQKGGDGGASEDATSRLRSQLELIPHEALCNAPAVVRFDRDPARASLSPAPPPLPPSATVRKQTKKTARARRGSSSLTWARIPPFAIDHDLPDHNGHDPFAPYCVPPDEVRTRPPTAFRSMEHFFVSHHVHLPSPSYLLCPTSATDSSSSPSCSLSYLPGSGRFACRLTSGSVRTARTRFKSLVHIG
ncbi:hypothetical protein BHE74_00014140 [Ensete ventricosum]|nr:hypothetical protein GW17_00035985 [Ensete ventricosum]RWW77687.1 hypothetical protein BHE74_00014140 [Ensete ventricosum]